jgi:hypothetical protein
MQVGSDEDGFSNKFFSAQKKEAMAERGGEGVNSVIEFKKFKNV